jgi:hypothetical protein
LRDIIWCFIRTDLIRLISSCFSSGLISFGLTSSGALKGAPSSLAAGQLAVAAPSQARSAAAAAAAAAGQVPDLIRFVIRVISSGVSSGLISSD